MSYEGWRADERPIIPPDRVACQKCGRVLRLDGPTPIGYDGTGARLFAWSLSCPSLTRWFGHDVYLLFPRRLAIEPGFDLYGLGAHPIYVEVAA